MDLEAFTQDAIRELAQPKMLAEIERRRQGLETALAHFENAKKELAELRKQEKEDLLHVRISMEELEAANRQADQTVYAAAAAEDVVLGLGEARSMWTRLYDEVKPNE